MNCGSCKKVLAIGSELQIEGVSIGFRTSKGIDIKVHFCSALCCWWGGRKYGTSLNPGAPTTKRMFQMLYPGAVQ